MLEEDGAVTGLIKGNRTNASSAITPGRGPIDDFFVVFTQFFSIRSLHLCMIFVNDKSVIFKYTIISIRIQDRVAGGAQVWRAGRVAVIDLSAHVAPRVRLCLGRPGRGHPTDPGLSRPPQHPTYRALHRRQSGSLRAVVAIKTHVVFYMSLRYIFNIN